MGNAHAEIEVLQKAFEAWVTNNAKMNIILRKENICQFCQRNVETMAEKIGLAELTIVGPKEGQISEWLKGEGWVKKGWL